MEASALTSAVACGKPTSSRAPADRKALARSRLCNGRDLLPNLDGACPRREAATRPFGGAVRCANVGRPSDAVGCRLYLVLWGEYLESRAGPDENARPPLGSRFRFPSGAAARRRQGAGTGAIRDHVRQVNADPPARGLGGRLQPTPRPRFAGCRSLRFGQAECSLVGHFCAGRNGVSGRVSRHHRRRRDRHRV
jgi:hypothetical protein